MLASGQRNFGDSSSKRREFVFLPTPLDFQKTSVSESASVIGEKSPLENVIHGKVSAPHRLPCLDGLRALSILGVMYSHARLTFPFHSDWLDMLFEHGHLGVYIFFVLSGYLITYLLRKENEATGGINLFDFYARRVLRIFPAFYAFVAVLAVLTGLGLLSISKVHFISAGSFAWNYKHLWDHSVGSGNWFLGHIWSLSLEEQFYLLWPVTLILFGFRHAPRIPLALILCLPLVRVITYFIWPEARGQLGMMVHTSADRLMFGCLLALWDGHPRFERAMQSFRHPLWPALASIVLVFGIPSLASRFGGAFELPIGLTLEGLLIGFLLAWLLRNSGCLAGRLLNSRPFVHIGVLSYSLYLWNPLFLTPLNDSWTGRFPMNLLCTLAAAEISFYLVEQPILKLRRFFRSSSG